MTERINESCRLSLATVSLFVGLLVATAGTIPASALSCADPLPVPTTADDATLALANLRDLGCLGGLNCDPGQWPLCKQVEDWENEAGVTDDPQAIRLAREIVTALGAHDPTPTDARLDQMLSQLERWLSLIETADAAYLPTSELTPSGLTWFTGWPHEIDLGLILDENCPNQCASAFSRAAQLYTYASLFQRILNELLAGPRDATVEYLKSLDKRWTTYSEAGRAFYPWEALLNSVRFKPVRGFVEPPTSQVLLLHPSAAYEISESDEELAEALLVELVGFYRWRGFAADNESLDGVFGGSLIVTWRDEVAGDGVGLGVMMHLPKNWSLGISYRDAGEEYSLVISADVAKLFTKGQAFRDKLLGK